MRVDLTVRHGVNVDDEIRQLLDKKVSKLDTFSKHIVAARVIVEKEGSELLLELNVTASRKVFTAKSRGFDLVDTIEDAVGKMVEQLRRHESRYKDKKKVTDTGR